MSDQNFTRDTSGNAADNGMVNSLEEYRWFIDSFTEQFSTVSLLPYWEYDESDMLEIVETRHSQIFRNMKKTIDTLEMTYKNEVIAKARENMMHLSVEMATMSFMLYVMNYQKAHESQK